MLTADRTPFPRSLLWKLEGKAEVAKRKIPFCNTFALFALFIKLSSKKSSISTDKTSVSMSNS